MTAPCKADPERWFPEEETPAEAVEETKAICFTQCPKRARMACLEQGVAEVHGIWGGWDEYERAALLVRRTEGATA